MDRQAARLSLRNAARLSINAIERDRSFVYRDPKKVFVGDSYAELLGVP